MLQYLVEKIHFKHVPPPTTSQTIAKPLLESQSHLAPRNGGEEETRKKEQDATKKKGTRVGPIEEEELEVQETMAVEETTREGE